MIIAGNKRKTPERRRSRSITDNGIDRPIPSQEAFLPFSEKKRLPYNIRSDFSFGVPPTPIKTPPSLEEIKREQLRKILITKFPLPENTLQWNKVCDTRTSKVYLVKDIFNQPYILKKINTKLLHNKEEQKLTKQEYIYGKTMSFPNIVKYYNCWLSGGDIYFQIEYCCLGSLEKYLQDFPLVSDGDRREKDILWNFFLDLLLGLQYINSCGLVHLDIKPGNIFVVENELGMNFPPRLKIGDFGNMQSVQQNVILKDGGGDGRYLPPEILRLTNMDACRTCNFIIDDRSDIYSLGLTVYEMATNFVIDNNTNEQVMKGRLDGQDKMSPELREIVIQMVRMDPQERPTAYTILTTCHNLINLRERLGFDIPLSQDGQMDTVEEEVNFDAMEVSYDTDERAKKKKKSEVRSIPIRKKLFT